MTGYNEMKEMVNGLYRLYERGAATAADTAYRIAEAIGGITGIRYKERGLSISDGSNRFSINSRGLGKRQLKDLLAALDNARTGQGFSEMHLGKNASSKHHKAGLVKLLS